MSILKKLPASALDHVEHFRSAMLSRPSKHKYWRWMRFFKGGVQIADHAWCGFYMNPELTEEVTVKGANLLVVKEEFPDHRPLLPKAMDLASAKLVDGEQLHKLLRALDPNRGSYAKERSDVLLSFHWDQRGMGMPILCCEHVANSAAFDPVAIMAALASVPDDILKAGVVHYIARTGLLLIRDNAHNPSSIILLKSLG